MTAPERTKAFLTQIYGENVNKKHELQGSSILIGRSHGANIKLESQNVSRKHCILTYSESNWSIKDNNSQNGTWISGKKLEPGESLNLQTGDIIFLGPPRELPQAFSFEMNYGWEDDLEALVVEPTPVIHDIELDDLPKGLHTFKIDRLNKKNKTSGAQSNDIELIELSPVGRNLVDVPEIKESEIDISLPELSSYGENLDNEIALNCSADDLLFAHTELLKRKLQGIHGQFSNSNSDEKRKSDVLTVCTESVTVPEKIKKMKTDDQSNEVSSTGGDVLGVSESLLDVQNEVIDHSSTKETEAEILKSKLALLTEEIKREKKEKLRVLKYYKQKNEKLNKQIATEQEKLKADLLNHELKVKDQVKKELLENLEEDLICNICTELLIKPIVLECCHTFCEFCINQWRKKKNECPMCRKSIGKMTRVLTLDHFVDKTLQTLTPEQKDKRHQLIAERYAAELLEKNAPKTSPKCLGRRARRSRGVARSRATSSNFYRRHTVATENNVLSSGSNLYQIPSVSYYINGSNYRLPIPEVLISDSEMDTINIYVS